MTMNAPIHPRSQEFLETFMDHPERSVERLERGIRFEDDRDILGSLAVDIDQGAIPILFGNHQSLVDGLVTTQITQPLIEATELEGFNTLAGMTSIDRPLHWLLTPIYEDRGLFTLAVFTEDEKAAALEGENTSNLRAMAKVFRGPKNNRGLELFPEASPIGGEITAEGCLRGMQQVERTFLSQYGHNFMARYPDRDVLFVPMAINGSHRIYHPVTNTPGELAIRAVCDNEVDDYYVELKVGEPVNAKEVEGGNTELLMRSVATMLPEEARGFYR